MPDRETGATKCTNKNGRLQTLYTDDMILNALEEIGEQTTPPKVAEKIGCNPVVARNKLKSLHERGLIYGNKLTGRWVFWI